MGKLIPSDYAAFFEWANNPLGISYSLRNLIHHLLYKFVSVYKTTSFRLALKEYIQSKDLTLLVLWISLERNIVRVLYVIERR